MANNEDPVKIYRKSISYKTQKRTKHSTTGAMSKKPSKKIAPSLSTRIGFLATKSEILDIVTGTKKHSLTRVPPSAKIDDKLTTEYIRQLELSEPPKKTVEIPLVRLPSPIRQARHDELVSVPSPNVAEGPKVKPRKPSFYSDQIYPTVPTASELTLRAPKSGLQITGFDNERLVRSVDLGYDLPYHKQDVQRYDELLKQMDEASPKKMIGVPEDGGVSEDIIDLEEKEMEKLRMNLDADIDRGKKKGKRTKRDSKPKRHKKKGRDGAETKYDEAGMYEDAEEEELKPIQLTKWTQKSRRESENIPKIFLEKEKIQRGTLESHSFTRLDVRFPKKFPFSTIQGNYHQGDEHFPEDSRNRQFVANCITAYCYSMLRHPSKWESSDVDHILECGQRLHREIFDYVHKHEDPKTVVLAPNDFSKTLVVGGAKFYYTVEDPEIIGETVTQDPKAFNILKGIEVYLKRNDNGLFFTAGICFAIWRNTFYHVFDPSPRGKDLSTDLKNGRATALGFLEPCHVATFLEKFNSLPCGTYSLCKINIVKKTKPDEKEVVVTAVDSPYKAIDDKSAIVNASVSFADKCFDVAGAKQAVPMCMVALAYSKITPACAWCKSTIDKVLLLGNELYVKIANRTNNLEVGVSHLPADFILGEYVIQYRIFLDTIKGSIFSRKYVPDLEIGIKYFFEHSSIGLVIFDKFAFAIWKDRNMYYLFDAHPCSNTGVHVPVKDGTACLTMHTSTELVSALILKNTDLRVDCEFSIHAIKVLKISTKDDDPVEPLGGKVFERTVPNAIPQESVIDIESNVDSIENKYIPQIKLDTQMIADASRITVATVEKRQSICDLDSASLSDTQIYPPRPSPDYLGAVPQTPSTVSTSTVEGEDVDYPKPGTLLEEGKTGGDVELTEGEGAGEIDLSLSLASDEEPGPTLVTAQTITTQRGPLPKRVLPPPRVSDRPKPTKPKEFPRRQSYEDVRRTKSEELAIETNFVDLPDGVQIIRGTLNVFDHREKPAILGPFITIAACIVAKKYTILSWNADVVDYVQHCGRALVQYCPPGFEESPYHEFKKVTLGGLNFSVSVKYSLDSPWKQLTMEAVISVGLFSKSDYGVIFSPVYSCAIFRKNNLYYLYDPYPCSKVGLGTGYKPKNKKGDEESDSEKGAACFMRFLTVHALVARILYNKRKREINDEFTRVRFILCVVRVYRLLESDVPEEEPKPDEVTDEAEGGGADVTVKPVEKKPASAPVRGKIGYQTDDATGLFMIQGTVGLRSKFFVAENCIKECHFTCLCAALTLMGHKLNKWNSNRIDTVIEQGKHIFSHAKNKEVFEKRAVTNVLIDENFFDVVISIVEILPETKAIKHVSGRFDWICRKFNYALVQTISNCYLLYQNKGNVHLFDPYAVKKNGRNYFARWLRFESKEDMKTYLAEDLNGFYDSCTFYSFEITRIQKAPKGLALKAVVNKYEQEQKKFREMVGKPFEEDRRWTADIVAPWSRILLKAANGKMRTESEMKWKEWDVEHVGDLYSLWGTLHQKSSKFGEKTRGRQTLANCIVAMLMVNIYEFSVWNPIVLDSILLNGDMWFGQSLEAMVNSKCDDFELCDLLEEFTAYPYKAAFAYKPVIEGIMFAKSVHVFNLYSALYYFFENRESRFGIIMCTDAALEKRILAFGKIRDSEYFMYDCQKYGFPLFPDNQGCSYILKMNEFNRLLHCMVLTLRDGDFYIYEIEIKDITEINVF